MNLYKVRFYSPKSVESFKMFDKNMKSETIVLGKKTNVWVTHNLTLKQVNEILIENSPLYITTIDYQQ